MSEVTNTGANASVDNPGTNDEGTMTVDQLRATNARLLEESKNWKTKYQDVKGKFTQVEQDKSEQQRKDAEENGRYKLLWEDESKRRKTLEENQKRVGIKSAVNNVAAKMGCTSIDDLLKLGNMDALMYDETSGEVHGVESFIEEQKAKRPWLFQATGKPVINASLPSSVQPKATAEKPLAERISAHAGPAGETAFKRALLEKTKQQLAKGN